MFALKRLLYERSPRLAKRCVRQVPFGWLAGRAYREVRSRDAWIKHSSADERLAFQRQALQVLLIDATTNVPAYHSLREAVAELEPEAALAQFPLLNKAILKSDFDNYVSTAGAKYRTWTSTTGGTTGDQLHFVLDDAAQSREMGFIHRLWSQVGYTAQCRKATFRGVEFRSLREGCYWQENPIYNEFQFSPFHISEETVPAYLKQLRRYKPEYVHGYPSAITLVAELLARSGETLPVRAVLLGSESVFPEQREQIQQAFEGDILSWYGHSERLILAGECEETDTYHAIPDYGWLEIVDEEGQPVADGESGELVGTGFWNRAMPLIRYRTGDRARRLPRECACGRSYLRFDNVEGRWQQEYVIGRNGAKISVAALNMHGPFYDRVLRYQYFQSQPGQLELRILPGEGFGEADVRALHQAFQNRVTDELVVAVKVVDEIPLTARGKLRRLIQEIPGNGANPVAVSSPSDTVLS
jgi:phenylacetate-CoA ligase